MKSLNLIIATAISVFVFRGHAATVPVCDLTSFESGNSVIHKPMPFNIQYNAKGVQIYQFRTTVANYDFIASVTPVNEDVLAMITRLDDDKAVSMVFGSIPKDSNDFELHYTADKDKGFIITCKMVSANK